MEGLFVYISVMKGKIIFWLCFICICAAFFYWLEKKRIDKSNYIKSNYRVTKGLVIKKSSYKGKSIRVKYVVDGKEYIESDSYSTHDNVEVGDSIIINYSTETPSLMITEFNSEYSN